MKQWVRSIRATTRPWMVIDAVHAIEPESDGCVGEIVERATKKLGNHAIISTQSRQIADLNRSRTIHNWKAVDEYRKHLTDHLTHSGMLMNGFAHMPILHIAVHGMDDRGWGLEIGTAPFDLPSCSSSARRWCFEESTIWAHQRKDLPHFSLTPVAIDFLFTGDPSISCHRWGDPSPKAGYEGFGDNYHHFQIEYAASMREAYPDMVVDHLVHLADSWEKMVANDVSCFDGDSNIEDDDAMYRWIDKLGQEQEQRS